MSDWTYGQRNLAKFIILDTAGAELPGLGDTFTAEISLGEGPLQAAAGDCAEIGGGMYSYLATVDESLAPGPVGLVITAPGAQQQNLVYRVETAVVRARRFIYTVTDDTTGLPVAGAYVWVTRGLDYTLAIQSGYSNAAGQVAFWLEPGRYYYWRTRDGWDASNPDVEDVI